MARNPRASYLPLLPPSKKSCDSYKREGERQRNPNERLLGAQIFKFFSFMKPSWNAQTPPRSHGPAFATGAFISTIHIRASARPHAERDSGPKSRRQSRRLFDGGNASPAK